MVCEGLMDKKFDDWLTEFDQDFKESKSWNEIQHYGQNEKDLLGYYIQFQNGKETKSLVRATWMLAGLTIVLALTSIWLAIKA